MATVTTIIAENLEAIVSPSLHTVAKLALAQGQSVELYRGKWRHSQAVETLVVDGDRAGQWAGGDASWGDWNEATKTVALDETAHVMNLDGEDVSEGA
ncbi:hypothetical protein [Myxococcus sp. NMCA1]|uniref:hypothetical protein n=1 Tax=Myxococcus sp. NMCA1 TaxID=2996785 RepID=UPI0022866C4A|nr:hypothetical protein [Myxococcus sp. NMCA1]WAM23792.1 hypothetical protein OZ403_24955 [Myxococcus sp. NMCA1]